MNEFKQYVKMQIAELRPVTFSEQEYFRKSVREGGSSLDVKLMTGEAEISISESDRKNGSPKIGDMIARYINNHKDQWLISEQYFKDNFKIKLRDQPPREKEMGISRSVEIIKNKTFRKDLDFVLQELKRAVPSRERNLAITKLQESIMWLGMDLKRLNEPNPYPDSYNLENDNVEPTADGLKL